MEQQQTKLGLTGLTPIIISRTIGEGIFNISKVLTEPARLSTILISTCCCFLPEYISSGSSSTGPASTKSSPRRTVFLRQQTTT